MLNQTCRLDRRENFKLFLRSVEEILEASLNEACSNTVLTKLILRAKLYFDSDNINALHVATLLGLKNTVRVLLKYGMDPNAMTKDGDTPIGIAANKGKEEILAILLDHGARIDTQDYQLKTALHHAVGQNHIGIVRLLLALEAGINMADAKGNTPIYVAAYLGRTSMVSALLEKGADYTMGTLGFTPFDIAYVKGHKNIVELIENQWKKDYASIQSAKLKRPFELTPDRIRCIEEEFARRKKSLDEQVLKIGGHERVRNL